MMRASVLLTLLLAPAVASAQASNAEGEDKTAIELQTPKTPPVDATPRTVAIPGPARRLQRDSADAGGLKGMRVLSVSTGEARVVVGGAERTLRPGDAIGADVVKEIGDGRLILKRSETGGSEALVIVDFDAQGRSRVRVLSTRDRTAPKGSLP